METITYEYEGALYVNLTNRCDCACVFCLRCNGHKGSIYADDLWLEHEPGREEALADFLRRDLASYREIVFCGFGEPMYRTDDILWLVDELKERVSALPPVRINTNGHANLILGRDVTGDLDAFIDLEYNRELYAEGQYFYYLKRNGITSLMKQDATTKNVSTDYFVLPIPDAESDNRVD